MADVPAGPVAAAFDLGEPTGPLALVQVGSFETWRLRTSRGSFLVKRLWQDADPSRYASHAAAMAYERLVGDAGVPVAPPISPVAASFGWATEVAGHGTFRAYEWLRSRPLSPGDDVVPWVGRTLATLHRLAPLGAGFEPEWRWLGVRPASTWSRWIAQGASLGKPWVEIARSRLSWVLSLSDRLVRLLRGAPDHVTSHRDFGPWNVLMTVGGPVLIDWETAGAIKASAEVGRVLYAFAENSHASMRRLLAAYRAAGGVVECAPEDLFLWHGVHLLSNVTERIAIVLGEEPSDPEPAWMSMATVERDITKGLERMPADIEGLTALGVAIMSP